MNRRKFNFSIIFAFLSLIIIPKKKFQKNNSPKNILVNNWNLKSEDILDV